MNVLIGYSMRSGSTLLQHILEQHPRVRSYSDLSSALMLIDLFIRPHVSHYRCIKPPDWWFLGKTIPLINRIDKRIWLMRDPRDSYLSSIESGYAYLFNRPGKMEYGIDTKLLARWKRIYRHYFQNPTAWHVIRYEDLVDRPEQTITTVLSYLELSPQPLLPFTPFNVLNGGDYKLANTTMVTDTSRARHVRELTADAQQVFRKYLGEEMLLLGYL